MIINVGDEFDIVVSIDELFPEQRVFGVHTVILLNPGAFKLKLDANNMPVVTDLTDPASGSKIRVTYAVELGRVEILITRPDGNLFDTVGPLFGLSAKALHVGDFTIISDSTTSKVYSDKKIVGPDNKLTLETIDSIFEDSNVFEVINEPSKKVKVRIIVTPKQQIIS